MTASLGGEPIEAVIFDWGGTLSTVSARELWRAVAPPLLLTRRYRDTLRRGADGEWRFERREITPD